MAYNYLSYSAAVSILAQRLGDPSQIYWNQPNQLLNYVIEAARLYQALTYSYKQPMTLTTAANTAFYSLSQALGSPIPYTATDVEVTNNALACLLEPPLPNSGPWTGTGQFTFLQLQQSLQNRLNRFIGESGRQTAHSVISGVLANTELVTLPDGVLDVRRAGWIPTAGTAVYPLGRQDEWAEQAYLPAAAGNPDFPIAYSVYDVAAPQLRLIPPTAGAGSLDLVLVNAGPTVNLSVASPVVLGIADDVSAGLKWGMLADLLATDGPSRDYPRAAYCEQRFSEYVQLARLYASVLTATINSATIGWGSIFDLDFYQPDWQESTGQPTFLGMAGRELVVLGVVPDDGTAGGNPGANYSLGLTVAASMPVPGTPSSTYLQISRDWIDPVMDYAQHIACFQMGGTEFNSTDRMYQNMIRMAQAQNGRLEAVAFYKGALELPMRKPEMEVERIVR
jgi:hypothetical protein